MTSEFTFSEFKAQNETTAAKISFQIRNNFRKKINCELLAHIKTSQFCRLFKILRRWNYISNGTLDRKWIHKMNETWKLHTFDISLANRCLFLICLEICLFSLMAKQKIKETICLLSLFLSFSFWINPRHQTCLVDYCNFIFVI